MTACTQCAAAILSQLNKGCTATKSPGTLIQAAQFSRCFQSAKVADAGPLIVAPRGIVCEKTSTERKLCVTVHVPK
jgi:hypothetical protein